MSFAPDYRLITTDRVTYPPEWEVDQERYKEAIELLKRTRFLIVPVVVAATGVVAYDNEYVLLHPQQLEVLLAYQYLNKKMTKEDYKNGAGWCNIPAIVVNDHKRLPNGDDDMNLRGERDPEHEEAILQFLDWDYGTQDFEEAD